MSRISLTNSPLYVEVDDADAPIVLAHTWSLNVKRGKHYAIARINRRPRYMHRLIMGEPLGKLVDHKDGETIVVEGVIVGLNNRRSNLRICTRKENMRNQKPHADRTGQFKGVHQEVRKGKPGKFVAQIYYEGKTMKLGRFATAEAAAMVYDQRAVELFGEYAHTNEGKQ